MPSSVDGVRLEARPPAETFAPTAPTMRPRAANGPDFSRIWQRVGREIDRGEATLGGAVRAPVGSLDAGTLIALQAGIYRYGEAIDLTVKLVDRASTAVRTILESGR